MKFIGIIYGLGQMLSFMKYPETGRRIPGLNLVTKVYEPSYENPSNPATGALLRDLQGSATSSEIWS
jgi:hypothetical protein